MDMVATSTTPLKTGAPPAPGATASVRLPAVGLRFINGVSSAYARKFPRELRGVVRAEDFDRAVARVNGALADYWPCMLCFSCGYLCCPCTLGLSFLCPNICIGDAEKYAREEIARLNRRRAFEDAGITWALRKRCGSSWIEVTYPAAAAAAAAAAANAKEDEAPPVATGVPPSAAPPEVVATAI